MPRRTSGKEGRPRTGGALDRCKADQPISPEHWMRNFVDDLEERYGDLSLLRRPAANTATDTSSKNSINNSNNNNSSRPQRGTSMQQSQCEEERRDQADRKDPLPPLEQVACADDFESEARKRLDRATFDYFSGGSDQELTLRWNRTQISRQYLLQPRALCNVALPTTTKYIFGDRLSCPIGLSPTAMHKMLHPEGELATVRGCAREDALMVLSMFATSSLEEVARASPLCVKWQNVYILKNRQLTHDVVTRAVRYGYRAVVVTCDAPTLANRRHDTRNQFNLGSHRLENIRDDQIMSMRDHSAQIFDPSVTWQDLADLKKSVGDTIRVIAKGIMCAEDALAAVESGVDGIIVSNHGGRQLDGAPATIEVLAEVVRAVDKRVPVFVDGGFRTGVEILKALALGAEMVFLGRAPLWGLTCYGERGVARVISMLRDELERAMMLAGCRSLDEIGPSVVRERH